MSFTVSSNIYESPSAWQLGGRIRVLYQEDHSENAHIDSFWQLWMPQFVLGIVGGGFSLIPLLILIGRRRSAQLSWSAELEPSPRLQAAAAQWRLPGTTNYFQARVRSSSNAAMIN
jgi:hypothetical protein